MTLEEISSAIRSNVGSGLKEVGNYTFSIEQIKDEVSNMRSQMIMEYSIKGVLNRSYFAQKIENIKLEVNTFPEEAMIETNSPILLARIPKLAMTKDNSSILYLGPTDMSLNIKLYFSLNDLHIHKYTRTLKNRPYGFVDLVHNDAGDIPVYLTNLGPNPFKRITFRGIIDDPVKLLQKDGFYIDDEEFPAPLVIQELIIDQLSAKYLKYFKQYSSPNEPNDQTDKS